MEVTGLINSSVFPYRPLLPAILIIDLIMIRETIRQCGQRGSVWSQQYFEDIACNFQIYCSDSADYLAFAADLFAAYRCLAKCRILQDSL